MKMRFVIAVGLALLVGQPSSAFQGQGTQLNTIFVNASSGDDSGAGTYYDPLLTLNEALQRRYDDPEVGTIKILRTDVPIAPSTNGGNEEFGWTKPGEPARKPFPIRLFSGVKIVGVPRGTPALLPTISIDEAQYPKFDVVGTHWEPFSWGSLAVPTLQPDVGEPSTALFLAEEGAQDITISSLRFDGGNFVQSKPTILPTGLWAINVKDFMLIDCEFHDLFNGIVFYAHGDVGGGVAGQLSATVVGGALTGFGPLNVTVENDEGHAGAWMIGEGVLDVRFESETFFGSSHDGLEIAGSTDFGRSTDARLEVDNARFEGNDNGLEVVGAGLATVRVLNGTDFVGNRTIGAAQEGQGVLVRGMAPQMAIRDSVFEDNTYGINWKCSGTARLDLGLCIDPGGNTFRPFDFSVPPADDHYRVQLLNGNETSSQLPMAAVGNFWIPLNQGADGNGEYLSPGPLFFTGPENDPAPGPLAGSGLDRNFSITNAVGSIDFAAGGCGQ